jgi:hypothetical protein
MFWHVLGAVLAASVPLSGSGTARAQAPAAAFVGLAELAWRAPEGCPDALEAHRARFPEGALAPERAAARALALCAAPGREDEARRVARAYIDAHGRSPLAARVRAACP